LLCSGLGHRASASDGNGHRARHGRRPGAAGAATGNLKFAAADPGVCEFGAALLSEFARHNFQVKLDPES
jgi:hypothetical protein